MADFRSPVRAFPLTAVTSTSFNGWRMVGAPDAERTQVMFDYPVLGTPGAAIWWDVTAPLGVPLYYEFISNLGASTGILGPITFDATDATWLSDPLRPWADLRMDVCPSGAAHLPGCGDPDPALVWGGFTGTQDTEADANLIPILNAEVPVDVFARRKYANGSFRFFSRTLEAIEWVYELFTAGGPLLIRAPAVYGQRDIFIQPGTVEMSYVARDQRRPERVWDVPYTVVDRPTGPIQGTNCNNWCEVEEAFPTFQDLTNYPGTWGDLMSGDVLCPDTPPEEDGFGMGPFGSGPFGDGG
jgi:hypothetical protein